MLRARFLIVATNGKGEKERKSWRCSDRIRSMKTNMCILIYMGTDIIRRLVHVYHVHTGTSYYAKGLLQLAH